MAKPVHATSPNYAEYTLCGDSFDSQGDNEGEVGHRYTVDLAPVFAKPGQTITCTKCRHAITEIHKIKNYKEPL